MLKDGVKVTFKKADEDEEAVEIVKLIDRTEPDHNDFLLTSQLWISGDYGKKRADLVGFVNGIPLVFIELKASHKKLELAYEKNLSDYKDTIPQVFWYNAFVILSNGSKARIGSMTAGMEHFAEWKKIDNENESGLISPNSISALGRFLFSCSDLQSFTNAKRCSSPRFCHFSFVINMSNSFIFSFNIPGMFSISAQSGVVSIANAVTPLPVYFFTNCAR